MEVGDEEAAVVEVGETGQAMPGGRGGSRGGVTEEVAVKAGGRHALGGGGNRGCLSVGGCLLIL